MSFSHSWIKIILWIIQYLELDLNQGESWTSKRTSKAIFEYFSNELLYKKFSGFIYWSMTDSMFACIKCLFPSHWRNYENMLNIFVKLFLTQWRKFAFYHYKSNMVSSYHFAVVKVFEIEKELWPLTGMWNTIFMFLNLIWKNKNKLYFLSVQF